MLILLLHLPSLPGQFLTISMTRAYEYDSLSVDGQRWAQIATASHDGLVSAHATSVIFHLFRAYIRHEAYLRFPFSHHQCAIRRLVMRSFHTRLRHAPTDITLSWPCARRGAILMRDCRDER